MLTPLKVGDKVTAQFDLDPDGTVIRRRARIVEIPNSISGKPLGYVMILWDGARPTTAPVGRWKHQLERVSPLELLAEVVDDD